MRRGTCLIPMLLQFMMVFLAPFLSLQCSELVELELEPELDLELKLELDDIRQLEAVYENICGATCISDAFFHVQFIFFSHQ